MQTSRSKAKESTLISNLFWNLGSILFFSLKTAALAQRNVKA